MGSKVKKRRSEYQEATLEPCLVFGSRIFDESFCKLPLLSSLCLFLGFVSAAGGERERTRDGREGEDGIVRYIFVRRKKNT